MYDVTARPNSLPWPPIIYPAAIAVSVLLNASFPLPWFGQPLLDILFVTGWLMIAAFVALNISAIHVMRRAGTTVRPDRGTDHLVMECAKTRHREGGKASPGAIREDLSGLRR